MKMDKIFRYSCGLAQMVILYYIVGFWWMISFVGIVLERFYVWAKA